MRSRYSAYAICTDINLFKGINKNQTVQQTTQLSQSAIDYIYHTYAPSSRANQSINSIKAWAQSVTFVDLEIVDAPPALSNTKIAPDHDKAINENQFGYVEFIASYIDGNTLCKLHERSRFIFDNQQWFYLDGDLTPHQSKNIGRNENCPCLSGKKFKRCHG